MNKKQFSYYLKVALTMKSEDADKLPSYLSEQVSNAYMAKVFTQDEMLCVIRAECLDLNGNLFHSELNQCYDRLKGALVI